MSSVEKAYEAARERYAEWGIDTEYSLAELTKVPLSIQCWQGDDVGGYETRSAVLSGGGLAATGNHPGKARTLEELRADLGLALSLIPRCHRINLHAMYGDFRGRAVDRDRIAPEHFQGWVEFARQQGVGLDFNATCFSHPRASSGGTLSSPDEATRRFWIEHVCRCREIGAWMGRELGTPCIHNLWIPDGSKDLTISRYTRRRTLRESLDEIYAVSFPTEQLKDAVESKLFGIGTESYVAGSFEFYLGWVMQNAPMMCLDMGHFHPTESVADKISSILLFKEELLLHLSRGLRWDSDHVVTMSDDLRALMEEVVRAGALARVHFALDYFDADINRVAAWVIGARATQRALLSALLEPTERLREYESQGDRGARLALLEECKAMPIGAIWDCFCARMNVPVGDAWIGVVRDYETRILSARG